MKAVEGLLALVAILLTAIAVLLFLIWGEIDGITDYIPQPCGDSYYPWQVEVRN